MSHRIPKTAAVVATAATAAFAAYAVGSQTNSSGTAGASGSATAGYGAAGYGYGYGPGPGGPRDGRRHGDHAADLSALAAKLGVSSSALKSALESLRPDRGDHAAERDAMAQKLADALNVDKAKVTAALAKVRPDRRGGPRDGAKGDDTAFLTAFAKELGVSTADLKAALTKLRADHEATEKAERAAFAQKLADKLGISVDKVKSVFADGPFGGHGGPGVHGPRHR